MASKEQFSEGADEDLQAVASLVAHNKTCMAAAEARFAALQEKVDELDLKSEWTEVTGYEDSADLDHLRDELEVAQVALLDEKEKLHQAHSQIADLQAKIKLAEEVIAAQSADQMSMNTLIATLEDKNATQEKEIARLRTLLSSQKFADAEHTPTSLATLQLRGKLNMQGTKSLVIALEQDDPAMVQLIIDLGEVGTQAHGENSKGDCPLHLAAKKGYEALVALLIEAGANVNKCNGALWTPLNFAAEFGHEQVVRLLLAAGADVHLPNQNINTPLHEAAYKGHDKIVLLLLNAGADVYATNKTNRTPLDLAVRNGHKFVQRVLRNADASLWS